MAKYWIQWALAGSTVMLTSCSGALDLLLGNGANPIPAGGDQLVIQPIQVCDNSGGNCAQVEFFQAVVDKVWAQAGIQVTFLPLNQLNNSAYLNVSDSEFSDLAFSGSAGAFGRHPRSTRDTGPINMWFVDDINSTSGTGSIQYGSAWIDANGVLISDDILNFGVNGRIDVIAHEVGHNLGLRHTTLGAGGANNIMSDGNTRSVPNTVNDIVPDGAMLGQLTNAQINRARSSSLLTNAAGVAQVAPDVVHGGLPELSADQMTQALMPAPSQMGRYTLLPETTANQIAPLASPAIALADWHEDTTNVPEPGVSAGLWLSVGLLGLWKGRTRNKTIS
ncbi:MAG: zinc-dependent metalloprotease family protein [Cyanobacteria bacterium J06632_22]